MIISKAMVEQAQTVLGLEGLPLTLDSVKVAYRTLAKKHHPDVGGDPQQFAAVDRAKCLLEEWLVKNPIQHVAEQMLKEDCPNCKGKGRIVIRKHFGQMTITCGRCKGSGDANWDEDLQDT